MTARADTAVALLYNEDLPAPLVLASGRGQIAAAIVRAARDAGVPLVEDRDLAASLLELEVNTLIPESLYDVVAALLVFVRDLRTEQ